MCVHYTDGFCSPNSLPPTSLLMASKRARDAASISGSSDGASGGGGGRMAAGGFGRGLSAVALQGRQEELARQQRAVAAEVARCEAARVRYLGQMDFFKCVAAGGL